MIIWLLYELGYSLHVLAQVNAIVVAKNNAAKERFKVLTDRWPVFLIRAFISSCVFWVFLDGGLPDLLTALKTETPGWLSSLSAVMNSQAGPPVAGLIGYGIDSMLAYIPFLKSYIPSDAPIVTVVEEVKPVLGGIQNTKQITEVVTTPTAPKDK